MFVFECDALLDLIVFGTYPSVIDVTLRMQFCKDFETLLFTTMINEPSRRLVVVSGDFG